MGAEEPAPTFMPPAKKTRSLDLQIQRLNEAVQKNPDIDTYILWDRLGDVLRDMGDDIGEVVELIPRLEEMEGNLKATRSDIRFVTRLLMQQSGYEIDAEPLEFPKKHTSEDNPGRRLEDNNKIPLVVTEIIKGIVIFVGGGVFLWLATDILPRIFTITPLGP